MGAIPSPTIRKSGILFHSSTFQSNRRVPHDHFYRHLERTLDLSFVREFVQKTYAGGGRPSIDPIVFFKLHLVMFFEGIVRCANRIL